MLTDKESDISLRIVSKKLNCAEISRILDLEPTKKFKIGEPYSKKNPKKLRDENLWIYKLDLDSRIQFEEQLEKMIVLITKKKESFKKLHEASSNIDLFCGYTTFNGQGGIGLESKLMGKLAELKINLIFDLYISDDSKE